MKAQDWLGYMEHATPERLWSFTENAGKGGCTIFAELVRQEQGRDLQGLPWCATFVHAVINRPDVLGKAHPGCRMLQRRMKRRGLWRGREYTPQTGDIIFCANRRTGHADHVGIVEETNGETVISIDGNTVDPSGVFQKEQGGAVARRARCRQDPVIVGYAATGKLICAKE